MANQTAKTTACNEYKIKDERIIPNAMAIIQKIVPLGLLSHAKGASMIRKLILMLLLPVACGAQAIRFDGNATTVAKNVPIGAQAAVQTLPFARVTICAYPNSSDPCTNTAPIFSDQANTMPIPQPIKADAQGRYGFWILPGQYSFSIQSQGGAPLGTYPLTLTGSLAPGDSTLINSDVFPGGDCYARIAYGDSLYAGLPVTFTVNQATTCSSALTLGLKHGIKFNVIPVASISPILLGQNRVTCGPGGGLASSWNPTTQLGSLGPGAGFFTTSNAADSITIEGCTFYSYAAHMLLDPYTNNTNIAVRNNIGNGTGAFNQQFLLGPRFTGINNYSVIGNFTDMRTTGNYSQYCWNINGTWNTVDIGMNTCLGAQGGLVAFGADAATYPSYTFLVNSSNAYGLNFHGNHCKNLGQSCFFASGCYKCQVVGNDSDTTSDYAFGSEGSAETLFSSNSAINSPTGCIAISYFSGFYNTAVGNKCTLAGDGAQILVKNNGLNLASSVGNSVIANSFICGGLLGYGAALVHIENTLQFNFSNNDSTNCDFDDPGVMDQGTIKGNQFRWTIATTRHAAGVSIPHLYQSRSTFTDNVIETSVAQPGIPCVAQTNSDSSATNYYEIARNTCGGWDTGIAFSTGGGVVWNVYGNAVPVLPSATSGTLNKFGNHTPSGSHD